MPLPSISQWRRLLGKLDGLLSLIILGCITGVATSLVMALFMLGLDLILQQLNGAYRDDFESLSAPTRFMLPILGSLALILLFRFTPAHSQAVGITHVLDRLQRGRSRLPASNAVFQFFAALISLGSGHSAGQEGPAVHIGASIANQLGQTANRVPSQLRLLIGCGTAAAISSAFDTPLAGVLFAMEVILMEYSLLGFTPIIAASVTSAAMTRFLLGEHPAFVTDLAYQGSLTDLPFLLIAGLLIGLLAAGFNRSVRLFMQLRLHQRPARLLLAGLITGALAIWVPQVLGLGHDTINQAINGELVWSVLLMVLIAKFIATSAAVGLGIPAGLIAPTLLIGASAGGLMGSLLPGDGSPAFYALLGMAAMMSAVLHAPLAALIAVLELSLNAHTVFPAMIVVLGANLVCQHGLRIPSIFHSLLAFRGLTIETNPVRTALAQRSLSDLATGQFTRLNLTEHEDQALRTVKEAQRWVVLQLSDANYLIDKTPLSQAMQDWIQLPADTRPALAEALKAVIPPFSRLIVVEQDINLLEAVRLLQREDTAGFLYSPESSATSLITRAQLATVLTTEGDLR
ncbi:MAG TPA: chloride channel protein [Saccharospirillum sp.]|nr:chloride channel protein [Saccharospirillum sp.]